MYKTKVSRHWLPVARLADFHRCAHVFLVVKQCAVVDYKWFSGVVNFK